MNSKVVVFDFDGTIADTIDTALKIYNNISKKYDCKPVDPQEKDFLRNKKPQEILKSYGLTLFKLPFIMMHLRKELHQQIAKVSLIKGMDVVLRAIKQKGFTVGILTSNSKENVKLFLEKNQLLDMFDFIYSSKNIFGKDKDILKLLKERNISKKSIIYVGDETRDIEAAKRVSIPIISVTWGVNTKQVLEKSMPDYIVDTPDELLKCLEKVFT